MHQILQEAVNRELQRIPDLRLIGPERNIFINRLSSKVKGLSLIKDFHYNNENNSALLDFRTNSDSRFKFDFSIYGPRGFGLYGSVLKFFQNKSCALNIVLNTPKTYSIKTKFFLENLKNVDFSSFYLPGILANFSTSVSDIKSQMIQKNKGSLMLTNKNYILKLFLKAIKCKTTLASASADMLSFPRYQTIAASIKFINTINSYFIFIERYAYLSSHY